MAENLAYRHIKVTLQTRVDGLGSSGHCHGVHRVSNIGGLRQQKLIHRNTLHCTALPGLGAGAGRHAALRQLAHNLTITVLPHRALVTAGGHHHHVAAASVVSLAAGPSVSRDQVSCSGPTTDTETRHRPAAAFTAGPGSGTEARARPRDRLLCPAMVGYNALVTSPGPNWS